MISNSRQLIIDDSVNRQNTDSGVIPYLPKEFESTNDKIVNRHKFLETVPSIGRLADKTDSSGRPIFSLSKETLNKLLSYKDESGEIKTATIQELINAPYDKLKTAITSLFDRLDNVINRNDRNAEQQRTEIQKNIITLLPTMFEEIKKTIIENGRVDEKVEEDIENVIENVQGFEIPKNELDDMKNKLRLPDILTQQNFREYFPPFLFYSAFFPKEFEDIPSIYMNKDPLENEPRDPTDLKNYYINIKFKKNGSITAHNRGITKVNLNTILSNMFTEAPQNETSFFLNLPLGVYYNCADLPSKNLNQIPENVPPQTTVLQQIRRSVKLIGPDEDDEKDPDDPLGERQAENIIAAENIDSDTEDEDEVLEEVLQADRPVVIN